MQRGTLDDVAHSLLLSANHRHLIDYATKTLCFYSNWQWIKSWHGDYSLFRSSVEYFTRQKVFFKSLKDGEEKLHFNPPSLFLHYTRVHTGAARVLHSRVQISKENSDQKTWISSQQTRSAWDSLCMWLRVCVIECVCSDSQQHLRAFF